MINRPHKLVLLAVIAAGLLPAAAANAHCCRSSYTEPPPLYPYVVTEAPYDVELTSNVLCDSATNCAVSLTCAVSTAVAAARRSCPNGAPWSKTATGRP